MDALWGQSHSRPSLAIRTVLSVGFGTGSNQECRHALRSATFLQTCLSKKSWLNHTAKEKPWEDSH